MVIIYLYILKPIRLQKWSDNMLKIINLDMSFKDLCIFKNVNVEINQNGLYAIEGRNGIGKTTLLKLISSFIKPTNGQILNDYKYSYVDSTYMIFDNLTVLENLKIICNDEDEIDKFLNDFQIYNIKEKQAILCSKGDCDSISLSDIISLASTGFSLSLMKLLLFVVCFLSASNLLFDATEYVSDSDSRVDDSSFADIMAGRRLDCEVETVELSIVESFPVFCD